MIEWRPKLRAIGWVLLYLAAGLLLVATPFFLYIRLSAAPNPAAVGGGPTGLLLQSIVLVTVFALLTWLIGHRILRLTPAELGWVPHGQARGFGAGMAGAAILALGSLLIAAGAEPVPLAAAGPAEDDILRFIAVVNINMAQQDLYVDLAAL